MKPNHITETARLIIEDQGDVLLVQRLKTATIRKGQWDLPGGKVDEYETPQEAACREAREETGIVVSENDVERISTTVDRDGDRTFIRHYWRIGEMLTRKSVELSDESRAYLWLPKHSALDLVIYKPHKVALEHSLRG